MGRATWAFENINTFWPRTEICIERWLECLFVRETRPGVVPPLMGGGRPPVGKCEVYVENVGQNLDKNKEDTGPSSLGKLLLTPPPPPPHPICKAGNLVAHSCTIFPCYLGRESADNRCRDPMNNNKDCRVGQLTTEMPNICYIFEILFTYSFQIWW